MRVVFVGASPLAVMTASLLIERGHDVVIIEQDRARIDEVSDALDCGFLHGDGGRPNVLREADPEHTDVLFCLSDDDKANILGALIGRSLGFEKVVPAIEEPELVPICLELGLEHTIVPDRTISRYLADMVVGVDVLELSTLIKGEARFFSFVAEEKEQGPISELPLPEAARVICFYRGQEFHLADGASKLRAGDEVVILTHSRHLGELRERWEPSAAE
jgi:trk system potassium uptake protein TrkA